MFQFKRSFSVMFIILVVLSVYYSTLFAEALSIDDQAMINNLLNIDSFTFKSLFLPGGGYYYRPLTISTFIVDKYLWGLHESFMHLENILLHALNACFVYYIAADVSERLGVKSPTASLFAALLFAMHPLATEPVNWISGRTDLLAGAFLFASCLLLLRSLSHKSIASLFVAMCLFFVSALAKETSIFWYPAIMFMVYVIGRDANRSFPGDLISAFKSNWCYFLAVTAASTGYFILRYYAFMSYDSGIGLAVKGIVAGDSYNTYNKVRITLKVFGFYLKKLVAPLPLNFTILSVSNWYVPLGIVGGILCIYLVFKRNVLSALLLMAFCIISPALLVPLGKMALAPVAERYLYMPSAFFAVFASVGGASFLQRYKILQGLVTAVSIMLLLLAGYVTWQRNLVWQTNLGFFEEAVRQNPDYVPLRNELARALLGAGRDEEARQIYLSIKIPNTEKYHVVTVINKATTMAAQKNVAGAIALLKGTVCEESSPFYINYLQTRLYLNGLLLGKTFDRNVKIEIMRDNISLMKKMQLRTGDPYCYYRIGQLCLLIGDNREAADYFKLAAEKSPDNSFYKAPAKKLYDRLSN